MGAGSDSEPVRVEMFGITTHLADSMQFLLEYACRLHEPGCFYLMPSFRGEAVDATHLNEFFHLEAEIAGDFTAVQALVEQYLRSLTSELIAWDPALLPDGERGHLEGMANGAVCFEEVRYKEAERILRHVPDAFEPLENGSRRISRLGERCLMRRIGAPIWLTRPPQSAVPFYQAVTPDGEALCGDLLIGVGEVCGAGERHKSASAIKAALHAQRIDPGPYDWYAQMKDRYPMRTAGFGIGVERLLCWVLGRDDVRCMELVPRRNGHLSFP